MNLLDGNEATLPVVEASALLEKYPRYASLVLVGQNVVVVITKMIQVLAN